MGRICPSSGCRSDACDVDHFNKLTDEPRSGLLEGSRAPAGNSSCRVAAAAAARRWTPSSERPGSVKRSNIKFPFVQVSNVHFGNVCKGSPASALQHSCTLMTRT